MGKCRCKKARMMLFICFALFSCSCYAQTLQVVQFMLVDNAAMSPQMQKKDLNGNVCALVRVQLPVEGCKFEGNVLSAEFDVSEYLVYLSDGSKYLRVKCPNAKPLLIEFAKLGIPKVVSKQIYDLELEVSDKPQPDGSKKVSGRDDTFKEEDFFK